jgi:hypothetical protein
LNRILFVAAAAALCWTQVEQAPRELLPVPGIAARAGLASPTRSPWIVANGWRFMRQPAAKFRYELPAGKAPLAAAEKHAYGADALLEIDAADAEALRRMTAFLEAVPPADLVPIADIGLTDDGTPIAGEVMNLLARRNLLYEIVKAPSPRLRVNITLGSREYPVEEAADPSAFALKIRRQLTDDHRALRIYGSEVVIARLTGDGRRARLHLINYGGREIEGLRVRLRGAYATAAVYIPGRAEERAQDYVVADAATEFSLPRLGVYAMIDLGAAR